MRKKKQEKKQVNDRRNRKGRNKSKVDIEMKWGDSEKESRSKEKG